MDSQNPWDIIQPFLEPPGLLSSGWKTAGIWKLALPMVTGYSFLAIRKSFCYIRTEFSCMLLYGFSGSNMEHIGDVLGNGVEFNKGEQSRIWNFYFYMKSGLHISVSICPGEPSKVGV